MRRFRLVWPLPLLGLTLFPVSGQAQSCPSASIDDALNDPVVSAAMDSAWANSDEGTDTEHEEGFWIYQCRTRTAEGEFTYTTEVDPGVGTVSSLTFPPRRADPSCRLIGHFHTHPGVAPDDPRANDPYENDQPSPQDRSIGLPGIITYGLGPTRGEGSTTDITYGPSANPNLAWTCPEESPTPPPSPPRPVSYNDPHLVTLDGLGYDFQAVGEFELVGSSLGGVRVQSRQAPYASGLQVSMNTALAFLVEGDIVSVQFDESVSLRVFINRSESSRTGEQTLPGGGVLSVDGGSVTLTWPDRSVAVIRVRSNFLNLSLALASRHEGEVSGLLGNFDGEPENDLRTSEGVDLSTRPPADDLYGVFADSWRVTDETSLFFYFDGEDTATFTDRLFPGRIVGTDDLSESVRAEAAAVCEAQGTVDALLLNNCILDVGISGDTEFAQASAELQDEFVADVTVADIQGRIDAPDLVCTDPVTVDASGVRVPDLAGRYAGTLTNPDGGTNWDADIDLRQCGVDFTGLMLITAERDGSSEQYRRFSGEWSGGQLTVDFAFPYSYTSTTSLNPCRGMVATLDVVDGTLSGLWTSDNCSLGGVVDVARSDEGGQGVDVADFVGSWSGPVDQPGSNTPYSVLMTLQRQANGMLEGTTDYPELECGGTLTDVRVDGDEFVFLETLTSGQGRCIDQGNVRVRLERGDTMIWRYVSPGSGERVTAQAVLSRR